MSAEPYTREEIARKAWIREWQSGSDDARFLATLDARDAEIERLRAEKDVWRLRAETLGVAELGVFNPNVASYCRHWEDRVEKADAEIAALRAMVAAKDDALYKVVIHTAHFPDAPRDLLVRLLSSCARCANRGLDTFLRPAPSTPEKPATGEGG